MAELAAPYRLGEIFPDCELALVKYSGTIKSGDFLKITGVDTDTQTPHVQKQTVATSARYVATKNGHSGEYHKAIIRGTTKVTFGASVVNGGDVYVERNEAEGSAGGNHVGFAYGAAGDADTALIYFNGMGHT